MAVPENIRLAAKIDGGAKQTGVLTVDYEDVVVLCLENASGVTRATYRIWDYPEDFPLPSGWTADESGLGYYVNVKNGADAPPITLPASAADWGDFGCSVEVNGRKRRGVLAEDLFNDRLILVLPSSTGVADLLHGESNQRGDPRQWTAALKRNARQLDAAIATGLGAGGDEEHQIIRNTVGNVPQWGALDASKPAAVTNLPYIDARHYGTLTPNSSGAAAANTATINAAIVAANAAGGGVVLIPPGVYYITGLTMLSNVTLQGAGRGCTTLYLADGSNAQVISMEAVTDAFICDLAIDGNRAGQSAIVHGIRGEDLTDVTIERLIIQNTAWYGIGVQDGANVKVSIDNVRIYNTGGDGIDFKNKADANEDICLSSVYVDTVGQNLSGDPEQSGIDIRGPARLFNIVIRNITGDQSGVRFRVGEAEEENGIGGHRSCLVGFDIRAASGHTSNGGVMVQARDVYVAGGYIAGCWVGLFAGAARCTVSGVTAESCESHGVTFGSSADGCVALGCSALSNGASGFRLQGTNQKTLGCRSLNNTAHGWKLEATSVMPEVSNCVADGNGSGAIDNATTTAFGLNNIGFTLREYATSANRTISGGVIAWTSGRTLRVDTEGGASSDELDTITGTIAGQLVILRAANSDRTIVCKDGTGNLRLSGDFSLDNTEDTLTLLSDGTNLHQLTPSNNAT
jgi:hypothetical protein